MDAVSYRRLSPRPDGEYMLGLDRQQAEIERVAKRRKLRIVDEYVDEDRSAFKGRRPRYEEMIGRVRAGEVRAIVAYDLDRLYRQPRELEDLIDLAESGVLVVTAQGDVDLSTSNGRLVARMVVNVASKSSEDESRRMKLKHAQLAEHGEPAGGRRPFGFKADRVTVDAREAKLIRLAAAHVLAGGSVRSIVIDWNRRGIRTANGAEWKHFTLKHVLTQPRIAGLRAHRGVVVGPAKWPAIITESEHATLRAILTDPSRRPANNGSARKYLLTGLAVCGLCGAKLVARPQTDGARSQVCASDQGGCGKIRMLAEPAEAWVGAMVVDALQTSDLLARLDSAEGNADAAELTSAISEDEATLEQLARDHFADRVLSRSEYLAAKVAIDRRLDENRSMLARSARTSALAGLVDGPGTIEAAWAALSLDRRRSVLGAVMDRVVVKPAERGGVFDGRRLQPVWRF